MIARVVAAAVSEKRINALDELPPRPIDDGDAVHGNDSRVIAGLRSVPVHVSSVAPDAVAEPIE